MKNIILFLMALVMSCHVMAQQGRITGTVTDSKDGSGMPGVSVQVKGTTNGTITDIDGRFVLNVTNKNAVLTFSCVGYKTQEVHLKGDQKNVNVALEENSKVLDEVVVVGYGTMKKSDLSGASVSLTSDKISGAGIINFDQALQGRAAGVTAVQTNGQPGSAVSIRVRGQSTINSGAEPLYVIDGVPFTNTKNSGASLGLGDALGNGAVSAVSPLSTINPADILSMEILKDASATAIYGSQGANGVVLITTKRGKEGSAKFTYDGSMGMSRQASRIDMMNLKEFAEFSNSVAAETAGRDQRVEFLDPSLLGNGTNWQDAVFQHAMTQNHQISAQGGTDKVKYFVSGSYTNQEGTVVGSKFDRYSFRTNWDAQLKSWLKIGVNLSYSETNERLGLADSDEGIISIALNSTPDTPIYDINGNYTSVQREGATAQVNPIGKALDEDNLLKRRSFNSNVYFDVNLMKGLVFRSEFAYSRGGSVAEIWRPQVQYGTWKRDANESGKQDNNNTFWQAKNYLTYNGHIDRHSFSAMIGQEAWESKYDYLRINGKSLPSNEVHNPKLGSNVQYDSGFGSSSMVSLYGRATYNYDDRYFATYTYRRDGSSNFGPKNRWANFHSLATSWRISNESWFKPLTSVINNLKLRLGWGQVGNQNIDGYRWGAAISKMDTGLGLGYRQANIANPYIKWETQEQWNIGLDFSFLNGRIDLVVDAYDKKSKDMLMQMQLPSYMGTRGNSSSALAAPWGNFGEIDNKGLEFSLTSHNLKGKGLEWDTELQMSFNKNKLVKLDGTPAAHIEGYGQWSDVVAMSELGKPLYNFYGYKVDGIYKDKADLLNSPHPVENWPTDGKSFNRTNTIYVGDLKFKDISGPNGKPDGIINEYDKTDIGSPMPKFTFGINNTFRYKNFDLNVFFNGSYGNKVMNYLSIRLSNMKNIWNNQLATCNDRARLQAIDGSLTYPLENSTGKTIYNWYDDIDNVKLANPGTNVPRAIQSDPNNNSRISDRYVEDGSYIRLKSITLGYTFPKEFIRKFKIDNLRLYANANNLFTITKYKGFDPEVGASTANLNVYGLDNGRYPSPQSFIFGLNITF